MSCGRSRNAAPSMYIGSWPKLYVTTALARFAGLVSMSVFTPGWRTKRSGRSGFGSAAAEARFASRELPQPASARQPRASAATRIGRTPKRLPAAAEQPSGEAAADDARLSLHGHDRRDLGLAGDDGRRSGDERLPRPQAAQEREAGDDRGRRDRDPDRPVREADHRVPGVLLPLPLRGEA